MLNISRAILFHPLVPCRMGSRRIPRQVGMTRSTTVVCLSCPKLSIMDMATPNIQINFQGHMSAQAQIQIQTRVAHQTITIHFRAPTRGSRATHSHPTMGLCQLFCPVAGPIIILTTLSHHLLIINMNTNVRGQCQLPWLDWS